MNLQEAISIVGSHISETKKMCCFSFGLPAKACITGTKLHEIKNSTCSSCYALRGNYGFPHVQQAQYRRLVGISHPQWVEAMVFLIDHRKDSKRHKNYSTDRDTNYFRWFDSGDLQSVQMLENIAEVCRRTEPMLHWLPTREINMIRQWFANGGSKPSNLILRLSATFVNGPLPLKLANQLNINVSGVHTKNWVLNKNIKECPAHLNKNQCGSCRWCFDPQVLSVSYLKH